MAAVEQGARLGLKVVLSRSQGCGSQIKDCNLRMLVNGSREGQASSVFVFVNRERSEQPAE